MSLDIQQREREGVTIVDLKGRITVGKEATAFRESVSALAAAGNKNVVLNLAGVDFIDTADVYGDGHSEQLIARALKARGGERPFVATKAGRRLPQQTVAGYSEENLTAFIDRSLKNLQTEALDLVQLH